MVERLGEMRKGRRERIEKGSREGIEYLLANSATSMHILISNSVLQDIEEWIGAVIITIEFKGGGGGGGWGKNALAGNQALGLLVAE